MHGTVPRCLVLTHAPVCLAVRAGSSQSVQALMLIDMQRDFFVGEALRARQDEVVQCAVELVAKAESAGVPVIVVRTVHDADGSTWALNMREDGQGVAIEGSEGAQLLPGLTAHRPVEIHKTRDSAFFGTSLAATLHELHVDHLVLAGVSTEACIAITAADAYAHDIRVTLAVDAIASDDRDAHRQALGWLTNQYRQSVCHNDHLRFEAVNTQRS